MTVGAAVAAFHKEAPVVEGADPEALSAVVEETLTSLADAGAPGPRLASLARFCRAGLAGLRAAAGRARRGRPGA